MTLAETLAYLDRHAIGITVKDGQPSILPPANMSREKINRELIAHLGTHREAIIAHFTGLGAETDGERRAKLIAELYKRAAQREFEGKTHTVYLLWRSGHATPHVKEPKGEHRETEQDRSRWGCVEGDANWTPLPLSEETQSELDELERRKKYLAMKYTPKPNEQQTSETAD